MDMLDYIVVGQGIAGSCLGFELLERGYKIRIFDDSWRDAACLVAAGVVNPITGKRLVKSWRSAVAHPYAKKFYRNLERELGAEFFHDRKILQLCRSPEEQNLWLERSSLPEYAEFIGAAHSPVPPGGTSPLSANMSRMLFSSPFPFVTTYCLNSHFCNSSDILFLFSLSCMIRSSAGGIPGIADSLPISSVIALIFLSSFLKCPSGSRMSKTGGTNPGSMLCPPALPENAAR